MKTYDLFIAGGGIGGSVAAKFAARGGLKTLFVEKEKTPRTKPCSGIQFKYFEKILGEKIPRDRLCRYQIKKVKTYFHDGTSFGAPFFVFNYMRKTFDHWLNIVAREQGAEFQDECEFLDFQEAADGIEVTIRSKGNDPETLKARYAIDATGLSSSAMRRKLRPRDFGEQTGGAGGINYYVDGDADLDPETLYQFWDLRFSDAMFAWIYTKTLDDGKDYWCIGTGAVGGSIHERQKLFYDFVREKFRISGNIIETEEYLVGMDMKSRDRVWLGQNRILMVGDTAGLLDGVRGVGQDAAAISGRLAARAILTSEQTGVPVLEEYARLTKRITSQTRANQEREIDQFQTNEELKKYIKRNLFKTGPNMILQMFLNFFRPIEKIRLLPP